MSVEAERAERHAAEVRLTDIRRSLIQQLTARKLERDPVNRALFDALIEQTWSEHRDATIRCDMLNGVSRRHAELRWRDLHDPAGLTFVEQQELERLDAEARRRYEQLQREFAERMRREDEFLEWLEQQQKRLDAAEAK